MSTKYPGGFITKSPVAPTTTAASGVWTLDQQEQLQKAGTWPSPPIFIEDLFSTYLIKPSADYTTYSINNGIDLSTKGGMTWFKARDAAQNNLVYDTARGSSSGSPNALITNSTAAQQTAYFDYVTPNTNGFTVNYLSGGGQLTNSGINYASWTFRKQPKFFDVVTYTGNGATTRNISHNLGSTPGFILVKCTSTTGSWAGYHRSLGATYVVLLNSTSAAIAGTPIWDSTEPTSTQFTVNDNSFVNTNGATYVAYLFAHDAGGFPASGGGSTNGISCGSYTETSTTWDVNLGFEPQWILTKPINSTGDWYINDTMRGFSNGGDEFLWPNLSSAASTFSNPYWTPNATGFSGRQLIGSGTQWIYIAIRRGPMKVPTSGTSVFAIDTRNATTPSFVSNFPVDMSTYRAKSGSDWYLQSRLTPNYLFTNSTAAEAAGQVFSATQFAYNTGWGSSGASIPDLFSYMWQRAPSFFDEVCYTGVGYPTALTNTHNLGVAPEMMIVKKRSATQSWFVYHVAMGNAQEMYLNQSASQQPTTFDWNSTTPSATTFTVNSSTNDSGATYVAYLFATCAGVSKVGSYTGTGALQTINCGFTSGARFVLIKRTDSTGDWYTYDSARGITSGDDPYLLMNSSGNEVTNTNYVDTDTTGFKVTAAASSTVNVSGGSYIFLAIA